MKISVVEAVTCNGSLTPLNYCICKCKYFECRDLYTGEIECSKGSEVLDKKRKNNNRKPKTTEIGFI